MMYLTFKWNEKRVDSFGNWGTSKWFLELDNENYPSRQIESYENGKILKYDYNKKNDQFGMLGDQPFNSSEMKEMNAIEISKADFEREWKIN